MSQEAAACNRPAGLCRPAEGVSLAAHPSSPAGFRAEAFSQALHPPMSYFFTGLSGGLQASQLRLGGSGPSLARRQNCHRKAHMGFHRHLHRGPSAFWLLGRLVACPPAVPFYLLALSCSSSVIQMPCPAHGCAVPDIYRHDENHCAKQQPFFFCWQSDKREVTYLCPTSCIPGARRGRNDHAVNLSLVAVRLLGVVGWWLRPNYSVVSAPFFETLHQTSS